MFKEIGEKGKSSHRTRENKHSRSWNLLTMPNVMEKVSILKTYI